MSAHPDSLCSGDPLSQGWQCTHTHKRKQKWGCQAGIHARPRNLLYKPALPTLLVANIYSLGSIWLTSGDWGFPRFRLTAVLVLVTETWLNANFLDKAEYGKVKGVCIYVNNVWCISTKMIELYCFTDLEFLSLNCRHFYLPRDFSVVFFTAVHMPPQAITKLVDFSHQRE